MTFSTDGQLVMVHTSEASNPYILIFKAADGSFVRGFYYYAGAYGAYLYPLYTRNMLLSSPVSGTFSAYIHTIRLDTLYLLYGF